LHNHVLVDAAASFFRFATGEILLPIYYLFIYGNEKQKAHTHTHTHTYKKLK
jgi:hypothetical protein